MSRLSRSWFWFGVSTVDTTALAEFASKQIDTRTYIRLCVVRWNLDRTSRTASCGRTSALPPLPFRTDHKTLDPRHRLPPGDGNLWKHRTGGENPSCPSVDRFVTKYPLQGSNPLEQSFPNTFPPTRNKNGDHDFFVEIVVDIDRAETRKAIDA